MKKTKTILRPSGLTFTPVLFALIFCLTAVWFPASLQAQPGICQLACNDTIQLSLGNDCLTEIVLDDGLEGTLDPDCLGPFQINLYNSQGQLIPTSPFVDDTYEGQYITAEFIDLYSSNSCSTVFLVEDHFIPLLECHNLLLDCGTAASPTLPVNAHQPISFSVLNGCQSIAVPIALTGNLVDLNVALKVSHIDVADLSATLASPNGTTIDLFDNQGNLANCNHSNLQVTFDDEAANTYADFENTCNPDPAISGYFQPLSALATFQGQALNGNWTFTLCNTNATNLATVNALNLGFNTAAINIPFPLPPTAIITQSPAQQGSNTFTISNFDNCTNALLTYSDDTEILDCNNPLSEIIYRTWTIEDAYDNVFSCMDTLSFRRLPAGAIAFPENYDDQAQAALLCDLQSPDPGSGLLPEIGWNVLPNGYPSPFPEYYPAPNQNIIKWYGTGFPQSESCESISYQYSDVRVEACSNGASSACFKILRTWTVVEECSGQNFTHLQILKVADKTAPEINGLTDLTISTSSTSCTATWQATIPQLTDNCNPSTNLTYTLHASAGTVVFNPNTNQYRVENLPQGIHTITYTAYDCCNNSRSTSIELTVEDLVPPTASCVSFITTSLTADGTVRILPNSFDDHSNDNCGELYYKVIRMADLLGTTDGSNSNQNATTCDAQNGDDSNTRFGNQIWFDDYVAFCCEDLADNHMVVLRVFDINPGTGPIDPSRMRPGGNLHGHFNDCMTEVVVEDKMKPTIVCPADITLECTDDYTNLNITGVATGTDNCQLDTIFYQDVENLNECGVGTVARIWTAMDAGGRTATCLQTITLEDLTDPVITFPPVLLTVECGEEYNLAITGMPQVSDNCSLLGINRSDELLVFPDSCLRKIIRRWTVMDFCTSQMYGSVQVIKIHDTTPPEISGTPPDLTVECDNIPAPMPPVFTDDCDAYLAIVFTENILPGTCAAEYLITRKWTATDNCLNSSEVVQNITVEDNTPPTISGIPVDMTLECDQLAPPANPTTLDNCDPAVDLTLMENILPGICTDNYILQRIWTATDDCGNTSQGTQLLNFEDHTLPVFTFIPANITLSCEEPIPAGNATATDNCDSDVNIQLDELNTSGACAAESTITRTWTATDNCGNSATASQTISIIDNTNPVLSNLPTDVQIECDNPLPTDQPTATDNCDTLVTVVFNEERTDTACEDKYLLTRTWTATDDCGNTAVHTQLIFVVDTTPPVFTNIPVDVTLECDGMPMDITPDATDNCDTMVTVTFMEDSTPDCLGNSTLTRTWMATDNCGNTAVTTQQITFMDSTPPQIIGVPADVTAECDAVPPVPNVTAMDACDPMVIPVFTEIQTNGDCTDRYVLTRTWEATDDCGNVATATQVVTVVDTTPPVFDTEPQDVTLACTDSTDPAAGGLLAPPLVSDNCDLMVDLVFMDQVDPGACINESGITRTWTATDNCGNTATRTQVIAIVDEVPPVLSGVPADVTVFCDAIPVVATGVTATDDCDTMVMITFEESVTDSFCIDGYTLVRRWIAEDNCGNRDIDTQLIVVIDTLAPMLFGVPGDSTVLCSAVPDPPVIGVGITATDNCDAMVDIIFSQDTTDIICDDEYTLVRRWTAIDNCGNMTVDSQRLMLIDTIPPSLFNIPADLTVACDRLSDTTSNMVVSATDNCDQNVSVVYREAPDGQCPNTYIIVRRWTATDNCGNVTTKQQRVQVLDTIPPMITCPANVALDIRAGDNIDIFTPKCDTFLNLVATATDNCADVIKITNDSPFALDTLGDASGFYPIGVHVINFIAEDRCGNTSTCSTTITIRDKARPTLLCSDFEIVLDPIDSTAVLVPGDFITLLADCSIDTLFFAEPVITDTLILDCSYFGQVFNIKITVIDTSGNATSCTLENIVITLPPSNPVLCGQTPPAFSYITGHVFTEANMPLENVMVYLDGGADLEKPTSASGKFAFGNLPTNYNYSVKPEHDNNPRNGVSTLDLVLISRHLLGLQPFTSPYQMIAADADNSGKVNTFDIIEVQKLILYVNDKFTNNTSWRFVDADYVFANPLDPFSSPFPEVCELNGLAFGVKNVDFVGVKIGDVNGSARHSASPVAGDREKPEPLTFFTGETSLNAGQEYRIDIRAADFKDLSGFQFTFDFDPSQLEFIGLDQQELGEALQFGKTFLADGLLTCNWFNQTAVTYDAQTILFSLHFRALANGTLSSALALNNQLLQAEAYTADLENRILQLQFRDQVPVVRDALQFELFPNRPNPFQEETTIAFQLPRNTKAVLKVTDLSGRILYQTEGNYEAGYHELTIASGDLNASGVLYYQLISEGQIATRKMVVIKK